MLEWLGLLCQSLRMHITPRLLRAARLALEMTQSEVASLAGLSERTLRRMEAGEWDSISKLQAVQKVLEEKGVHFHPKTGDTGYGLTMPLWWE